MVEINLLPWREYTRLYEAKIVKRMVVLTLWFVCLSMGAIHYFLVYRLQARTVRVANLKQEVKSARALNMTCLSNESRTPRTFNRPTERFIFTLGKLRFHHVCFTEVMRHEQEIRFQGKAYAVSDLLKAIDYLHATQLFQAIKIEKISLKNNQWQFLFRAIERD